MTEHPAALDSIPARVEVAVVGAGLAGLTAARHLARAGRDVHLFDPNSRPGGRVRSEVVDGHCLDLGFQVLLTGYPAVQEELDLPGLHPSYLEPGCVIVRDGRHYSLPDPFRTHRWFEAALFPLATVIDKLKTVRLREHLKGEQLEAIFSSPERTAAAALRDFGFSSQFLSTFWIPFFSAAFLDPPLEVTTRMFDFVFRCLALGDIVLPRGGMGSIGAQIASRLPAGGYHPSTRVTGLRIEEGRVRALSVAPASPPGAGPGTAEAAKPDAARTITAETVIVAAGVEEARRLTGLELPALEPLGVSVVYFSSSRRVSPERRIFLNGGGSSPGHHCVFLSNIAPDYAPPGSQLISVTILGTPESDEAALAERARAQMEIWFPRGEAQTWRWLATYKIPMAQFRQPPGLLGRLPGPVTPVAGLFLAGDYTRHSSVQGALESGRIAARAVLQS
jgi:phytoene dehydrogenase-like protein